MRPVTAIWAANVLAAIAAATLTLAAVGFVICMLIALLGVAGGQAWLTTVAYTAMQLIALFGIPAAMGIAILRNRLYDIDVIISRAVVYGLLHVRSRPGHGTTLCGELPLGGARAGQTRPA